VVSLLSSSGLSEGWLGKMSAMWERRLLSALIAIAMAAVISRFDLEGIVFFTVIPVLGLVALLGGMLGAERLEARRHHTQG
jgi:hypothetical protein